MAVRLPYLTTLRNPQSVATLLTRARSKQDSESERGENPTRQLAGIPLKEKRRTSAARERLRSSTSRDASRPGAIRRWSMRSRLINRRTCRNLRFEAVAAARYRPDQAQPVVAKSPSQLANALDQRVVSDREIGPDCDKKLVLRDQPAGIFDKVSQNCEGLWP